MAISNPVTIGTNYLAASANTIDLVTTAAVTAGAKILLVVGWFDATDALVDVSDGTNTYRIDKQQGASNRIAVVSADCPAGLASGATITANWGANSVVARSILGAYSTGVVADDTADYGAVGQGQSANTTWSSTTTTVTSGDLLWGGCHWEDSVTATNTASGGNTELHDTGVGGSAITSCYQIGTGAAIAASGTWNTVSNTTTAAAVAYSAAAGIPAKAGSGIIGP